MKHSNNKNNERYYRIVIKSVGTATPSSAASVAAGLGVPASQVIEAFYRAPTILIRRITLEISQQMSDLLTGLGYEIEVQDDNAPPPPDAPLYDVSVYITEPPRYTAIISALSKFLGTDAAHAATLLSTPPGIVLGEVSEATIKALKQRLGIGVDIIASDPKAARYDLFLGECHARTQHVIAEDLKKQGHDPLGETGCLARNLVYKDAQAIWARHQKTGGLRVINQDFLRFDVMLLGRDPDADEESYKAVVEDIAGIPADLIPHIFDNLPVTILEAVRNADLAQYMDRLAQAGLLMRADLITFMNLGLEIVAAKAPRRLRRLLCDLGLLESSETLPALPYKLPYAFPELQARLLRASLTTHGVQSVYVDAIS